ncbi:MAG TPA: alpha-amylase family glycosyl hydrolase [Verrucomicrobiota bacterium]|nr:alpha-amylase family glycosyl hydrolase [Verrucomicrobiota bacterium]HNT13853.1 alpha-amylase family glycosyl hydrolase [Verrucomicrobiota bacterium]
MVLYNLFPLLAGTFGQWPAHLERARVMNFDWVYINPIQRPGASGSLYSIAEYHQLNPGLANPDDPAPLEEQCRAMIAAAHALGLKLMVDLVINHCAYDSPLLQQHPDWFAREPDGRIAHAACQDGATRVVWKDLAQLDFQHTRDPEGLFQHCQRIVEYLLGLGFDGFRCDAAYMVPAEFWRRLIAETRRLHPHVCFAAETLGCSVEQTRTTARAGFDYVFNSSKWWDLHSWWLIEQYNLIRETAASISFPESHDTPRLCEELNGNLNGLKQRYLLAALFSAGVMMPMGFEYGLRKPLHVVHTTPADWQLNGVDLQPFITAVNRIKRRFPVFQTESLLQVFPCHNPNILLMWKAAAQGRDEALLILNKDPHRHQEFATDHFRHFVQAGAPLRDVSPEYPLEFLPEPFHYALRPGQGIVLVTRRD